MTEQRTAHPEWSHRSVTLICGPPASGKSTLAATMHTKVIELEQFDGPTHRERLKLFGRAAYRIGRSATANAAIVRGAPTIAEREHHQQLCRPSLTIVLLTPAAICHQRITDRGRARAAGEHEAVDEWWSKWTSEHPPIASSGLW